MEHEINDRADLKLKGWLKFNDHLLSTFFELAEIKFQPDIDPNSKKLLQNYDESDVFGFLFHGKAGVGKSLMMKRMCIRTLKAYATYEYSLNKNIVFMPMGIFSSKVRKTFDEVNNFEERCLEAEFLYLDDMGAEYKTDFLIEKIFTLLDYRVAKALKTFVSTNLNMADISKFYGERISSRLNELCIPIQIKGEDQRKTILANRVAEVMNRQERPKKELVKPSQSEIQVLPATTPEEKLRVSEMIRSALPNLFNQPTKENTDDKI